MAPKFQPSADYRIQFPVGESVTFDIEALDTLIKSQGVMLEHWRAMRCPVGVIDRYDSLRRPHEHHENCSNGMIYTLAGTFQGTFTGNGLSGKADPTGTLDSSSATIIIPRFYTNEDGSLGDRIYPAPYDRLYYADPNVLVSNWEVMEAHITGQERLSFPATKVFDLIDARGVRYREGDYQVVNGNIVWQGQNQPGQEVEVGKGRVYSLRYLYRPFWYVSRMIHEIRLTSVNNEITGERIAEMAQKLVSTQREYIFLNEENDSNAPDATSARKQWNAGNDGSFGPK